MTSEETSVRDWKTEVMQDLFVLRRFALRYAPSLLTLAVAAVIGWVVASSLSNYTHGGWELHIERRFQQTVQVNIHFHHWYYGLPLFLLSLLLIQFNSTASNFLFGLGQSLAAHSYINEHGIPSIIEGGPTWNIPPEIYFPVVTALALLYAFFLVRREEWLARAREREEVALSYVGRTLDIDAIMARLDEWARKYFSKKNKRREADTQIWYVEWRGLDIEHRGEWQLHCTVTPFEPGEVLWVFRLEHIPMTGSVGLIDEWLHELDEIVSDKLQPVLLHELNPSRPAAPVAVPEHTIG
ncbi:MAG: hypothetical protein ACM3JD_06355 [Rudaea sp.]